ncbi:MAG TPA: hypothetical protein VN924_09905 [Bryobacteraceae bacterium]|nr:hypothetical protein [Bryobacteraceae bacterium]
MSEPGVNTPVIDRVRERERTGSSALMMLVTFSAQFVASLAGGAAIARFGGAESAVLVDAPATDE